MTTQCPYCHSEINKTNPAILMYLLSDTVRTKFSYEVIEGWGVGRTFTVAEYSAALVDKKTDPGYPANGYDGAWEQGSTFEAYLVFEIAGHYFKKTGTGDSYGDISWDGDLREVKVVERVVKSYE